MRILLCSLSSKYVHSSLSVWYLLAGIRQSCIKGIATSVLECTINQPSDGILQKITEQEPDVIAFSCYIWNITLILEIARQIKELLPHTTIVLGGPEVTYNPEEVLTNTPEIDYIVCGEGEIPFPMLISRLQSGSDPSDTPGLCFCKADGILQCNPPAKPLPEPPTPYMGDYFSTLVGRIAYLETSRGCPFSCEFCLSGINGHNVRFFNLERARDELLLLANSGAKTIKLVDRTFNCNPSRAKELFEFVIENAGKSIPLDVCFHFEVAADLFDCQTLDLLTTAPPGLIQLEAGLQTFNPDTLEAVSRKTDLVKLEENIRLLLAPQNIHIHIDLIAGLPYEDFDSFADSFDRAYSLSPHMLQLGFLKMLHGSALRLQAEELGYRYSPLPPYEVSSNPWLSKEDMQTITKAEHALQKLYNSGRFLLTLEYVLSISYMRPFHLFCTFGEKMSCLERSASLNELARLAYEYFCSLPGVEPEKLRDKMVCDFLSFGSKQPDFLKIPDKRFKQARSKIRANLPTQSKPDAALLYAGSVQIVYACGPKSPVTDRRPIQLIPVD